MVSSRRNLNPTVQRAYPLTDPWCETDGMSVLGHEQTSRQSPPHVRYFPESGYPPARFARPLSAINRHSLGGAHPKKSPAPRGKGTRLKRPVTLPHIDR